MNYGSVAENITGKSGTAENKFSGKKMQVEILPIIGLGSAPFRGNFKRFYRSRKILERYPSVQTFTINQHSNMITPSSK